MIAIVDDKAARRLAEGLGIPRTGTLGVLAAAAQAHYVSDFAASASADFAVFRYSASPIWKD